MTLQNPNAPKGKMPDQEGSSESICPNLGGPNDQDIYYQYASNWNRCYQPDSPQRVSPSQQSDFCLCDQYVNCPVYKADWNGVFPPEAMAEISNKEGRLRAPRATRRNALVYFFVIASLLLAVALFFGLTSQGGVSNLLASLGGAPMEEAPRVLPPTATLPAVVSSTSVPEPTENPTNTSLPAADNEPTATLEPTATFGPTATPPPPTSTPFPTPGPGLATPFGPENGFAIHVVVAGETFTSVARKYGSSAEAVEAINQLFQGSSLWVGQQLVVPVGVTERGDLPKFTIIFTTESFTLDELSRQYTSDPEEIRFYNNLGESESVPSGRWLILPIIESN